MIEYYIVKESQQCGPFTKDQLVGQNITGTTKVWFYGIKDWVEASDVSDLKGIIGASESKSEPTKSNLKTLLFVILIATSIVLFLTLAYQNKSVDTIMYDQITKNAYESDEDLQMYVDKFYRDARFMGIYPKQPKVKIIKFSRLDQLNDTTHIHGMSYGINNDDLIEIYINPSSWKNFNKPMRYMLMYHELAHDILNLNDLESLQSKDEKLLMYPYMTDFRSVTMDEFIESYQRVFLEYLLVNN
jgi:hypothetical protein